MTFEKADKIVRDWKEYMEINDKLGMIFISLPESFLPYPMEILEEAINIVAKSYYDEGDIKTSDIIKESVGFLVRYKDDEEAIKSFPDNWKLNNPEIRKLYIQNLKRARDSWIKSKKSARRCYKCGHIANIIRNDAN